MARKERAGKTVYLYEPLYNKLKPTTYKEIAKILGVEHSTAKSYGAKGLYHHKLDAYILKDKPTITKKREMNENIVVDDEVWKETKIKGLLVSNYGRFKGMKPSGKYSWILTQRLNKSYYIYYNSKMYSARYLVYETFIGKVKDGNKLYFKNKNDKSLKPENLIQTTFVEYAKKINSKTQGRPVVFLNEDGDLIDEYRSIRQASRANYVDRRTISNMCNKKNKKSLAMGYANAFMWADEYYEKEGIC